MTGSRHIGNARYVVRGVRDDDGRRWAIHSTDDLEDAERVLAEGVTFDGRHWSGVAIHDRREALLPPGGWGAAA
jgi:hypothetical protein